MKLNKLVIYLLILVALGAWLYFVEIKHKEKKQAAEEQASRIVSIDKDQVVQIDLKSKDAAGIEIKKPADVWVLTSPLDTRADQSAIASLLQSATSAAQEKVLMEKDVNGGEYGLDQPSLSVGLATKDARTEIFFGESNPSKTSYYVRISGDPRLFLVADTLKNSLNKTVLDLRDKTVVAIAPSDVDRIVISRKGEETELRRETSEKWVMVRPEEMRVKSTLVNRDLNNLTNLTAKDIIDKPLKEGDLYGLENPDKQIKLAGPKIEETLDMGAIAAGKEDTPAAEPDVYARIKGHDTVYVIDARTLKGLVELDRNLLRDRSVLSFNPADIEKLEIDLDGKKWLAVRGADKKWALEQPQKIENVDGWSVTSILWDLKDLEWKNVIKEAPGDLSALHLAKPQLVASIFKMGQKEPMVLKAGWDLKPAKKDGQGEPGDKKDAEAEATPESKEKSSESPSIKPDVPKLVNAMAEPAEEKGVIFEVGGNFIGRLRNDLERIVGKK